MTGSPRGSPSPSPEPRDSQTGPLEGQGCGGLSCSVARTSFREQGGCLPRPKKGVLLLSVPCPAPERAGGKAARVNKDR